MSKRIIGWIRHVDLRFCAALVLLLLLLGLASAFWRARTRRAEEAEKTPPAAVAAIVRPTAQPMEAEPEPSFWAWPVEGEIIGPYSPQEPVWSQTLSQWQTHPAIDIAGMPGEAVYACADGTVLDAYRDRLWGNVIVIGHDGGYQSTYAGVNTLKLVSPGDAVTRGDVISAVGEPVGCEADMASHLHFALSLAGQSVDFTALMNRGASAQGDGPEA